jgi:hypothetical protein
MRRASNSLFCRPDFCCARLSSGTLFCSTDLFDQNTHPSSSNVTTEPSLYLQSCCATPCQFLSGMMAFQHRGYEANCDTSPCILEPVESFLPKEDLREADGDVIG